MQLYCRRSNKLIGIVLSCKPLRLSEERNEANEQVYFSSCFTPRRVLSEPYWIMNRVIPISVNLIANLFTDCCLPPRLDPPKSPLRRGTLRMLLSPLLKKETKENALVPPPEEGDERKCSCPPS